MSTTVGGGRSAVLLTKTSPEKGEGLTAFIAILAVGCSSQQLNTFSFHMLKSILYLLNAQLFLINLN